MIKVDQRNKMKRKTTQLIIFLVLFLNFGFIVSSFLSSVSIGEIKRGKKVEVKYRKNLKIIYNILLVVYKQAQNNTITTKYRTLATIGFPSVFLQLSGALKHQAGLR